MSARCVHVIDDEEAIRRSLQLILRVLSYDVRTFASATSFLATDLDRTRDCILLDLRMPDMDGLEMQRRLNASGAGHSVIVMSGHGGLGLAVTGMEAGAIAFLEKPFSRAALEQVLVLAFLRLEDPDGYRSYLRSASATFQELDPADQRVLELIARGHDSDSIAEQAGFPLTDVELSRSRIYAKLGAETVTDVLRLAFAARRAAPH